MAKAEVIDLHEYFLQCQGCDGTFWAIQYTQDLKEIMQLVCANPECECVIPNPGLGGDIYFEPDFELDDIP